MGLPGAGKTALAKRLEQELPAVAAASRALARDPPRVRCTSANGG